MAVDVTAVRNAIQAAVQTTGLPAITYIADSIDPPLFEIGEVAVEFEAMEHIDSLLVLCRLFVSLTSDVNAQLDLDKYLQREGPYSIKAAIETDRTLTGSAQALVVERVDGYRLYVVAGLRYLGAEFQVRVWG